MHDVGSTIAHAYRPLRPRSIFFLIPGVLQVCASPMCRPSVSERATTWPLPQLGGLGLAPPCPPSSAHAF